ncbi:MAG: M3 family oligoendopeptidase [Holosporales bacterium]|jgi:oligoendopeptidase F|nr:M3 family oligoendopeptidase [Holosporales bacterium]
MIEKLSWDLSDIKCSEQDEQQIVVCVSEFIEKYGANKLSIKNLQEAIIDYEKIGTKTAKLGSYAFLQLQTQIEDEEASKYFAKISEFLGGIAAKLAFFTVKILEFDIKKIKKKLKESKYLPWIENFFRYKDHFLTKEGEEVFVLKDETSSNTWVRLYDKIMSKAVFKLDGKEYTESEILQIMSYDESANRRKAAAHALHTGLNDNMFNIEFIYNCIMLDVSVSRKIRKYNYPEDIMHAHNDIDKAAIDAMTDAVVANYSKTAHRYYKIKAKLLGYGDKIEYWDRNAAVKQSKFLDRHFSYEESTNIVLSTFGEFSPIFRKIAENFITQGWIDVMPKKGKRSGAFAHPCSVDTHQYIILNFFGKIRDVSTMAHELGHGIHMNLAAKKGTLLAETPLTLSEIASIFCEKLVFEKLKKEAQTPAEKIDLLCMKLEDSINTIIRQVAFFNFERKAHKHRECGELSSKDLSSIFLDTQRECLGPHVKVDDIVGNYWGYVSHFFHSPFYVYSYAFAEIMVVALYNFYKKVRNGEDFKEKYINMLSNGGAERYDIALGKFNLDTQGKEFWDAGVKDIVNMIDELESLQNYI